MKKLQLDFDREFNRFTIRYPYMSSETYDVYDRSFSMVIDRITVDETKYHFIVHEDGEWCEALTLAQYKERVQDIIDNECKEVADIWEQKQESYCILSDDHPAFSLQRKWEAIRELDILDIPVNLDYWRGKPHSQSMIDTMDAARAAWMRKEAEEMANEMKFHDNET